MDFDIDQRQGFYGPPDDPIEEYFQIRRDLNDLKVEFEVAYDGEQRRYTVSRPTGIDSSKYVGIAQGFEGVLADSAVSIARDFPVADGPDEVTTLTFYASRRASERDSYALVDISVGEKKPDGAFTWLNRSNGEYDRCICLDLERFDENTFAHAIAHPPIQEDEAEEIVAAAGEVLNDHEFEHF